MSRRSRERKLRRVQEQQVTKTELKDRYLASTATMRKWLRTSWLMLAGIVVSALVIFGTVKGIKSINPSITGPFGTIKRSEVMADKFATLKTDQGDIKIALDSKQTPKTVANFVLLAKKNFYDGIRFHRIIDGFMIQTGDPNSKDTDPTNDGMGGPGYKFDDEKITGSYTRGTVAMANSGPNTNGSQFFIMQADNQQMPKNYVIFGKVVAGMDVVDKIAKLPVEDNGQGEKSRPKKPITINKVELSAN